MNHCRIVLAALLLGGAGCGAEPVDPASDSAASPVETGTAFEPARAGRIAGRVTWTGPIPDPPPFLYGVPIAGGSGFEFRTAENPNRPRVDPKTRAAAGIVVSLRGIDPARGRSWDLPPVNVEIGRGAITVVQGDRRGRAGFVRRGDTITVTSTDPAYQVLRGRGDGFFSLPFPEPNRPVTRALTKAGRVELSSGTGLYWARADLFVVDHPYFAVTDADGRFVFDRVPPVNVEVVAWAPGWQTARTERDPDSTQVARLTYSAPIERSTTTTVERGREVEVMLSLP